MLFLSVSGLTEKTSLNIFDMSGQTVYKDEINEQNIVNKPIDLNSFPKGVYFVRLLSNQYSHIQKIVLN
jgi:hypothetical protein